MNILDDSILETRDEIAKHLEAISEIKEEIAGYLESIEENKIELQIVKSDLLDSQKHLKDLKLENRIIKANK